MQPDLKMAQDFLDALAFDESFAFQTFPDSLEAKRSSAQPTILHGRLKEHAARLTSLNQQGHGVFVMVNRGDGRGRRNENVLAIRACFIDLDGAPVAPVLASPVQPAIVVESSPEKWHAYWKLRDSDLRGFKGHQQHLARHFGGDRSVCDLSRVMRLPGFVHRKNPSAPFLTRLVLINGKEYKA